MASTVISSGQFGFVFPTSFGPTFTLAIFCDTDFCDETGKLFLASEGDNLASEFVAKSAGTVTAGVGTFNTFSLPKTDLSRPNTVRYYGRIFNYRGAPTDYFPFSNMHMRESLGDTVNFLAWWNDNQQRIYRQADTKPNTDDMNTAINAVLYAPASTTQLGLVELTVNPVDTARPKVVTSNDYGAVGHPGIVEPSAAPVDPAHPIVLSVTDPRAALLPNILAAGTGTMVNGLLTISSALVAADSPLLLIPASDGITGTLHATNRVVGVSVDVRSSEGADAGFFRWFLLGN